MSTENAILNKLTSIDEGIKRLVYIAELRIKAREDAKPKVDLDGQYGDPTVHVKDPRDWTGDSMLGRPFSECPPEYLDLVADRLDYFAEKETDEKKRNYNKLDAARARGWAARIRGGWKPPAQPESPMVKEDEIAF